MFQKLFLALITIVNLVAMGSVQSYSKLEPFYILALCYIGSSIIVLGYYSLFNSEESDFLKIIDRMVNSGKAVIYLAFLAVIDLLIFMLLVPNSSLSLLEKDLQMQFIFFGLLIFFIPIILAKFSIEPKGKEIEERFWFQFIEACKTTQPSNEFALFILARVQMKFLPPVRKTPDFEQEEIPTPGSISDEISTTTFPLDYQAEVRSQEISTGSKNALFDSDDMQEEDGVFDKYFEEIYTMIPEVRKAVDLSPVSLRPELFLNIIIEKTVKDEKMVQFFQNCTQLDVNNSM